MILILTGMVLLMEKMTSHWILQEVKILMVMASQMQKILMMIMTVLLIVRMPSQPIQGRLLTLMVMV